MAVFAGGFLWYFIPGLLMPALSYFSVITWFAPKNVVVANLVRDNWPPAPPFEFSLMVVCSSSASRPALAYSR